MEEVILGVEFLIFFTKFAAPLTQLVDSLLHSITLEVLKTTVGVVSLQAIGLIFMHVVHNGLHNR